VAGKPLGYTGLWKRGTSLSHSNGSGLRAEPGLVPALRDDGQGDFRTSGNDPARGGFDRALFRAAGTVAGFAHGSLSRFVWIDVVIRLASRTDIFGFGDLSQATVGGGVCPAVYFAFLPGFASCADGPCRSNAGARRRVRLSRYIEHFGLRRVCALICTKSDISWRTMAAAQPAYGSGCLAAATFGAFGADEPKRGDCGLVSIVIGTTLGFVWVDRLLGTVWYFDPKYIVTLLLLVLYAAYLWLARSATWRGARASKLCIFNFVLVIFSFTAVNLFFSHMHRYF